MEITSLFLKKVLFYEKREYGYVYIISLKIVYENEMLIMTTIFNPQAAVTVGGIVLNALAIEHFILRHPSESIHVCEMDTSFQFYMYTISLRS